MQYQEVIRLEMRNISLIIFLVCFNSTLYGQAERESFAILTIEKKSSSKLHPLTFDYWIISESMWRSDKPFLPLFIDGFSKTDLDECCLTDTLTLFNPSKDESFDFKESYKEELETYDH